MVCIIRVVSGWGGACDVSKQAFYLKMLRWADLTYLCESNYSVSTLISVFLCVFIYQGWRRKMYSFRKLPLTKLKLVYWIFIVPDKRLFVSWQKSVTFCWLVLTIGVPFLGLRSIFDTVSQLKSIFLNLTFQTYRVHIGASMKDSRVKPSQVCCQIICYKSICICYQIC